MTEIAGQVLTGAAAVIEKRRRCKFIAEWCTREDFSPWLACVNSDPHKAYCVLCEKLFPVSHGGLHDVKAHQKGKRHTVLEQEEFEKFLQYGVGHFQHLKNSSERKRVYNATTNEVQYRHVIDYSSSQDHENHPEVTFLKKSAKQRKSSPGEAAEVDINGNQPDRQRTKESRIFGGKIIGAADQHVVGKFRCAEERGMCSQPAAGKMEAPQQYCLRWKYHHSNLQAMFSQLLERECFCDVTLACEGKTLKAHKVMLSACSTYFDSIFSQYEESNPIVILKDVKFSDIKALVQFMYKGEINVDNSELTSLLKTAEELRIKGLAEVSWRSDREMEAAESGDEDLDQPQAKRLKSEPYSPKSGQNTISASLSSRDDYNESQDDMVEEDGDDGSENECSTGMWDTERSRSDASHFDDSIDVKPHPGALTHSITTNRIQSTNFTNIQPQPPNLVTNQNTVASPQIVTSSSTTVLAAAAAAVAVGGAVPDDDKCSVTSASAVPGNTPYSAESASTASVDLSQYPDIMKMNDYLESGGRRPQFWEEPFTKRLMEAIKNKELEMKVAAELMGVSYGTLYGRYRDAYGCLKHPYRVRDFWSEQGPAEVLAKLQRKELTLFRAAEMLNVTVTTLANYLSTLRQGGGAGSSDNEDVSDNEDMVIDEDKVSTHSSSTTHSSIHNNPDITIVKKENLTNLNGN